MNCISLCIVCVFVRMLLFINIVCITTKPAVRIRAELISLFVILLLNLKDRVFDHLCGKWDISIGCVEAKWSWIFADVVYDVAQFFILFLIEWCCFTLKCLIGSVNNKFHDYDSKIVILPQASLNVNLTKFLIDELFQFRICCCFICRMKTHQILIGFYTFDLIFARLA